MKNIYYVEIELYNDDGLYKVDFIQQKFNNMEYAFNYMIVILNEIINDKQLEYKAITIKENNKIINRVEIPKTK